MNFPRLWRLIILLPFRPVLLSGVTVVCFFQPHGGLRPHKYFRVAKKRKKKRVSMCQPLSDYYYKLDSKSRARYDDKISYIGNRDPYNLQKGEFSEEFSRLPALKTV